MNNRLSIMGFISVAFLGVSLVFSNCSKVTFEQGPEMNGQLQGLSVDSGAIVIDNGAEFTKNAEVTATLNHNSAVEMYVTDEAGCSSGGTWEPYATFKRWPVKNRNGELRLYAKFREKEGSAYESSCSDDSIIHDDVPPYVLVSPAPPAFVRDLNHPVAFNVGDNLSGVATVECKKGAGAFEACQNSLTLATLGEGNHSFEIRATDRAGNQVVPLALGMGIDLTPPVLVFNQTPPARTADLNALFAFTATDALSGVDRFECRLDAGNWATCTSPNSLTVAEGTHAFSVRAYDRVGNVSQPLTHTWTVDRTAPSVRITSAPTGFTNQAVATVTFDGVPGGKQIVRFECSLDGSAFATCTSPFTSGALAEGTHTFRVRGYDDVGNVSQPAQASWTVDLTAPMARIISGPAARTSSATANLVFEATDNLSGIRELQCSLDGAAFAACTSPREFANLAEGSHNFQVRAVDQAGNVGPAATHSWVIDLTRPTIRITSAPSAQSRTKEGRFEFVATDANGGTIARIECRLDAQANWTTCTSPQVYANLDEGNHSFQVRAVDSVGLISDPAIHNWLIDSLGPAINISQQPAPSIQQGSTAVVQYTVVDATGLASVRCGFVGQLQDCPAINTVNLNNLPLGDYTFRIEATDVVGNMSSRQITFRVENRTVAVAQSITVNENRKADILVVIDNSGSMNPEQQNMAARFGTFLDQLAGLDWKVAITTTDPRTGTVTESNGVLSAAYRYDGRILPMVGLSPRRYTIDSAMNLATAKQAFASTIQRPQNEGSGNEQGVNATYRVVQRSAMAASTDNPGGGFIRSDAVLSVVVVTDADETNPNGTQVQNMPSTVLNLLQVSYPGKPFKFHSIIVRPGDSACLNSASNEDYGDTYNAFSGLTGGIVGTVCSTDYGSQLTAMGQAVVQQVNSATLNCLPLDTDGNGQPNVQIVTANGSAPPAYTVTGSTITFAQALPPGNNQLNYTCLAP